jgi:hypothetical protein
VGMHLEVQGAQGLSFVAALLSQREHAAVCDGTGCVAEVPYDGDTVLAAGGACAGCYTRYTFSVEKHALSVHVLHAAAKAS